MMLCYQSGGANAKKLEAGRLRKQVKLLHEDEGIDSAAGWSEETLPCRRRIFDLWHVTARFFEAGGLMFCQ